MEKSDKVNKKSIIKDLGISLVPSLVEAGSGFEKNIKSMALIFNPKLIKCSKLAKKLRLGETPVVGFIKENRFYIDLKVVLPSQLMKLSQAINSINMAQIVLVQQVILTMVKHHWLNL